MQDNSANNKLPVPQPDLTDYAGCYLMKIDVDSALLTLKEDSSGGGFTGSLNYKPKQAIPHEGSVVLKKDANYLKGWYSSVNFEGRTTVTEKIFRPTANGITEGVGEMDSRNDTAFFKYPSTLRYEDNFPFRKTSCN